MRVKFLSFLLAAWVVAPAFGQSPGAQPTASRVDADQMDGVYEGLLRCETPGGKTAATSEAMLIAVLDGQARFHSVTESFRVAVAADGAVSVTGVLRAGDVERPISFSGAVKNGVMRWEGHRGGRNCAGAFDRTFKARPVSAFRAAYDPEQRRSALGRPNSGRPDAFVCPAMPPPLQDLRVDGFYAPETNSSVIDPQAMARYRDATGPLGNFQEGLTRMADRDLATSPRDFSIPGCALSWLDSWATADALLGPLESRQSRFERKWFTSTVALVYGQLRADGTPGDREQAVRIERWLRRLAYAVLPDYALPPTDTAVGRMSSARNNHLNWAALTAVAVGKATDDGALIDWGTSRAGVALREVDADGYLPLELQRRSKARHYHLFAIKPLVMIAEMVSRDGVDLYEAEGGALRRLANRCVIGINDPSGFVERAGADQEYFQRDALSGADIAWLEPYDARFPSPEQTSLLSQYRSVRDRRLGGDMTRRFSPLAPAPKSN